MVKTDAKSTVPEHYRAPLKGEASELQDSHPACYTQRRRKGGVRSETYMAVSFDLKFILLEILPTPELKAQGRELRIQNHLEMVHDCIWALNKVIIDAQMRALKEPAVEEWVNDVGIAIADVEDLLRSILGWQPRGAAASNLLPCSFPNVDGVASRHAILLELEEEARRLNYLVRRGSSLCLRKEMMDSTYPRREEEDEEKKKSTSPS
ncbi:resistance protein [Musa troglodytarum]|uniref:Resistance protein n=1 Tax=Musa troglodytarum TaxID=320322 RepID=A0A9E7L9H9_9LILI|nr:resistance protein [Musa troglodytarum]